MRDKSSFRLLDKMKLTIETTLFEFNDGSVANCSR